MRGVRGSKRSVRVAAVAAGALVAGLVVPAVVGVSPASAAVSFGNRVDIATSGSAAGLVAGDFTGDGKIDVAAPTPSIDSVQILAGDGTGGLTYAGVLQAGTGATGIATGYLNGDARLDLVATNFGTNTISVFLSNSGGSFNAKADYVVGTSPYNVAVGDLNGDARPDIVATNAGATTASVLLNTGGAAGTGTFGTRTNFLAGSAPGGVALADVNGDTTLDLITASRTTANVSVLPGLGNGAFAPKTDFATASPSNAVRAADVNGDSKVDLITGGSGSVVSVLTGNGAGSFTTPVTYPVGATPSTVAVADVTGDAKPDIVTADNEGTRVTILENGGNGAFVVGGALGAPSPISPVVADLNGDSAADVVTGNTGSAAVSRWMNLGAALPPTVTGSRTPAANANGWNNTAVLVSFTCGGSQIVSCTSPIAVSNDGANQSATGKALSASGQSATTTVTGINIDKTLPSLSGVAASLPNAAGWYNAPVTMVWTCSDLLSGIAGSCPANSAAVGEGQAVSATAVVTDKAGNLRSASSQAVKIDTTKPSTAVTSPPTWSKASVALTLTPTDALSGVAKTEFRIDGGATQTGTSATVSDPGSHIVQYWSTDVAGNVELTKSVQVRIDVQAPSITASRTPAANAAGWNKEPVTVSFTCDDDAGGSGVASCSASQTFPNQVDTTVTGTASDVAGNVASVQAPVRIDLTAPTVTAQVPAANANGWFNEPVQVPFSCTDTGGSGVASCPAPVVFSGDGADQPVTGTGSDLAGNEGTASGSTVSLDTTDPTISGVALNSGNGAGGYYGDVIVRWTCDDALSGVVACPGDVTVTGEGVHELSRSVTDRAGNTTSAQVSVRIDHDPMTDPGIVHGTLTSATTGASVVGATVTLRTPANAVVATTTSGTDGTYTFPTVPDGTYKIYAVLNLRYQGSFSASTFPVGHGTNTVVNLALTPTISLSGTVRAPDGSPIGGATVRIAGGLTAITDAAGHYAITGNLPGPATVTFSSFGTTPSGPVAVDLTTDQVVDQTLAPAPAGAGIKGTISNRTTGAPLSGALVRIWPKGGATYGITVTTGADGRFSLPSLGAGTYEIDVVRVDYQVRWFGDVLSRSSAAPVTVTASCTSTPDLAWGDPCSIPVNTHMG